MPSAPTTCELDDSRADPAPIMTARLRRRESLSSNRPDMNTRQRPWLFVGKLAMPSSEHLIPFRN